jgi:hypothetical protein
MKLRQADFRFFPLYSLLWYIKYILNDEMRSGLVRMRSGLVVRASDCQCTSCNGPGFDPSIRRHSGIWGAADEAVPNIVRTNILKKASNIFALCRKELLCPTYFIEVNYRRYVRVRRTYIQFYLDWTILKCNTPMERLNYFTQENRDLCTFSSSYSIKHSIQCKKSFTVFPSPDGMSLKTPPGREWFNYFRPGRVW